jgi:hypothetical protein
MPESAYERGYRHGTGSFSSSETAPNSGPSMGPQGGNFFSKRLGPLPVWAWMGILIVGVIMYYFWQKNQTSSSSGSGTSGTGTSTTDSSLVPQFVNQVYTQPTPPGDGNTGPTGNGGNPTPTKSTTQQDYSWTDTGQKLTLDELAKKLGVSVAALMPANAQAKHVTEAYGKGDKKKLIPKGAHFTYTKQPKTVTTFG